MKILQVGRQAIEREEKRKRKMADCVELKAPDVAASVWGHPGKSSKSLMPMFEDMGRCPDRFPGQDGGNTIQYRWGVDEQIEKSKEKNTHYCSPGAAAAVTSSSSSSFSFFLFCPWLVFPPWLHVNLLTSCVRVQVHASTARAFCNYLL